MHSPWTMIFRSVSFMMMPRCLRSVLSVLPVALLLLSATRPACADEDEAKQVVKVFEAAAIDFDAELEDPATREGLIVLGRGQTIQDTVKLPKIPANQRHAKRIVARVEIEPVPVYDDEGRVHPGDPWTRLGTVTVLAPGSSAGAPEEVEIMRFITPFGGSAVFEQDVTSLAPLLAGKTTVRLSISTWMRPSWKASLTLTYTPKGVGFRRPVFAEPLFNEEMVTAEKSSLRAEIRVPQGLAPPRIRILTTGHATDGRGGDEFITRTHVLRIDGREIARWRPWAELGGPLRERNPTSGRQQIDDRWLWSSDLDRSGWHPGTKVSPEIIPVPELTAGRHVVEVEIEGIRPREENEGEKGEEARGYWRVSAVVVADEPWPAE